MEQSRRSIKKEWKSLKGTAKLQYIWDYYKLPIFLVFIALYAVGYVLFRSATAESPQLYIGYVNVEIGETLDHQLTDEFISFLKPEEKNSVVRVMRDLILTENLQKTDSSYLYASQMKILSSIDSQKLDIVLMNKEAFDAFSQNGLLFNLEVFAKENHLTQMEPYFVDNIEILSDNASEVIVNPQAEYQSRTAAYPMGIDITGFPVIAGAGFPDRVSLGIIANTPRPEAAAAYISYLSSAEG